MTTTTNGTSDELAAAIDQPLSQRKLPRFFPWFSLAAAAVVSLAVLLPGDAVTEIRPPLPLAEALPSAPPGWRPVLEALLALGAAHRVTPRVFGSLAWAALTGLDYLGPASDLDLLWPVLPPPRMAALLAALGGIETRAPMRLDGEVLLPDGSGANWREIQAGAAEILVKRAGGVALLPRADFLGTAGAA